jgi:hypothetical protein
MRSRGIHEVAATTVAPRPGVSELDEGDASREHAYIVDLSTMKIVWTKFGDYGPTDNSSAKQGLAEMSRLLGL